ncbi:MAG: M20/M25/M40 family metallo-hydrolase [Planctomycetota bacterium]|nr:M20/M25/M40 family metallo-hydrolase [Planctomycetota bacterium]
MNFSTFTTGTFVASLFVSTALQAQDPAIKRIIEQGIEKSQVMAFQDHLCNTIGQRLTGSAGYDRAAKWAREEFEKMGLEARLDPWGSWKMAWDRGQWQGRVLEPFEMELQVATPAWTGATRGQVKGRLIRMPADLDAKVLDGLFADGPAYLWGTISRRSNKPALLEPYQRSGKLLGVVMSAKSTGLGDRSYPNQIRVFGDSSVARRQWDNRAQLVQAVVRNDQAEKIEAALADGKAVKIQLEIRNRYRKGPVTLNNVVADLKGTEFPDEHVIICGHLDSWHQAAGATDNGTGSCSTLEAARILSSAGVKPRRTIRFILWSGEEQGLLGSRAYVQRNRSAMDKVSAVFNHDNGTNWASSVTVTDKIAALIAGAADAINMLPKPDPKHETNEDGKFFRINSRPEVRLSSGGSDHASFAPALVPAFGWRLTGKLRYGYGWHSQWDTYDLVVPEYQRHNATTFALMAYTIAQLDQKLPREGLVKSSRRGGGRGQAGAVLGYLFGADFKGLQVTKVNDSGFAKNAGMKIGDVITALNGKAVKSPADITSALRNRSGNRGKGGSRKMSVKVKRDGKEQVLEGERPRSRRRR